MEIKLFKDAFHHSRPDPEIYHGFGFFHLENVTYYYVHPENEAYDHHTSLAQPIAEGLSLFWLYLDDQRNGTDYLKDSSVKYSLNPLEISVTLELPEDYRKTGGNFYQVEYFNCYLNSNNDIYVVALNLADMEIKDKYFPDLDICNYWLPLFFTLTAREYLTNGNFREEFNDFLSHPDETKYVRLVENFYQNNKREIYNVINTNFRPDKSKEYREFILPGSWENSRWLEFKTQA